MGVLKKLAGQTAIYGLSSIVGRFLNYLLVPLYTYTFPPQDYGIVTEFYAYIVVLQILLTYGMETGFFRFSKKEENPQLVFSTVLISIISTSILFFLIIFVFSKPIATGLGYPNNSDFIIIFTLILVFDSISAIFFANLRALNKAKKFALFKIINILSNIFFNVFFIILCPILLKNNFDFIKIIYNPEYGVGYIFVSNLIASFISIIVFIPDLKTFKFNFDFKLWKQILLYSLPLLLTGLAGSINEMADRILIKQLTTVPNGIADTNKYLLYQLGIYGANAKLAFVMMLFVQAFRYASEPFFFSYNKESDERLKVFADVMKYFIIFSFSMFLVVILNIDIFKYIIGKDYYEGLNVVLPLFLSRILVGVFFILSFWYKLYDVTAKSIYIYLIGIAIVLAVNFIFLPKFGYIAAAWANFFCYLFMVIASYLWSLKYMKVDYKIPKLLLYSISAILIYFISKTFSINNLFISLLLKNLLMLVYVFLIFKVEKIKISSIKRLILNFNKK